MPPKKKKEPKEAAAVDAGEVQQQAFIRQALQANVMALKEQLRTVAEDNEALRKTRGKVTHDCEHLGAIAVIIDVTILHDYAMVGSGCGLTVIVGSCGVMHYRYS